MKTIFSGKDWTDEVDNKPEVASDHSDSSQGKGSQNAFENSGEELADDHEKNNTSNDDQGNHC